MKKIIGIFLTAVMVFCLGVNAFAAENKYTEDNTDGSVYAKIVENVANKHKSVVKDGKAKVTLPNGDIFEVSGLDIDDGEELYFSVVPADDEGAKDWIGKNTANIITDPLGYEMFIEDKNGKRVTDRNFDGSDVKYIPADMPDDAAVTVIGSDGKTEIVDSENKDGGLNFKGIKSGIVAVGKKVPAPKPDPESPQTGDFGSRTASAALVAIASAAVLLSLKKRNRG